MVVIDEIEREQQWRQSDYSLIRNRVAALIDAVEAIQDWSQTHVGDMIEAVQAVLGSHDRGPKADGGRGG